MSGLFDKGDDNQTVTQRAEIPAFLQPFLTNSAATGNTALNRLRTMLSSGTNNIVAPFTDPQNQAFDLASRRAMGESGFFPTAQSQLLATAQGRSADSLLPPSAMSGLSGFGGGIESFLPPAALAALTGAANGTGNDTLSRTAGGEFLFGGNGFDQAVQAAVRAARPGILSTFKRGGVGGATGGLAEEALGRAAIDAFAGQFGQERSNQLNAASQIGNQRLSAAGLLGDFAGAERGRGLQANSTLAGLLGGLTDSERNRSLQAAMGLPGIATADIDLLSRIGAMQQGQNQRELTAPIDMQQMLLQLAMGAPLGGTIGSTSTQTMPSNGLLGALGLAGTGLGIANAMAPSGATGLAALGGPLGLGLSLGLPLLGSLFG